MNRREVVLHPAVANGSNAVQARPPRVDSRIEEQIRRAVDRRAAVYGRHAAVHTRLRQPFAVDHSQGTGEEQARREKGEGRREKGGGRRENRA
eukprot:3675613-Rhodomonas_salina.1